VTRTGRPCSYAAQWNDDFHHAAHVVATGVKTLGYYADYSAPVRALGRALAEGFVYQAKHRAIAGAHGAGSRALDCRRQAFVSFLQNHDQIGNRAFGERLAMLADEAALRAAYRGGCCYRRRSPCSSWRGMGEPTTVPVLLRFRR